METPASVVYLDSLDPEVTKVCPVCLVVKVYLDFPVLQSRVRVFPESLVSMEDREHQATPDPRERLGSTGFLE